MKNTHRISVAVLALGVCFGSIGSGPAVASESDAEKEANRVAHDNLLCHKYGYENGTPELANCLDTLARRRADAAAEASTKKRQESSHQRAVSNALTNGCDSRSDVINGGSRANAGEVASACSH